MYKVAVASTDGKTINAHFNKTRQFLVYDLQRDGSFQFLESRLNVAFNASGEHNEDALQKAFEIITDCNIVLVSRIGTRAERLLNINGIRSFSIQDEIGKSLEKLAEYYRKTHQDTTVRNGVRRE